MTYEIGTDSILIVRTAADTLKAFHNICPHRGRRLDLDKAQGLHGNDGYEPAEELEEGSAVTSTVHRTGKGSDARVMMKQMQKEFCETVGASPTEVLVDAAERLVDELPEGTRAHEVHSHWLASYKADYAAMGMEWPAITEEQMAEAGLAWHIFPTMSIFQGPVFALCYRVRPFGNDPDNCIYEAVAIERYSKGQEPATVWVYAEPTEEN